MYIQVIQEIVEIKVRLEGFHEKTMSNPIELFQWR